MSNPPPEVARSNRGRNSPASEAINEAVDYYLALPVSGRYFGSQKEVCAKFEVSPTSFNTILKRRQKRIQLTSYAPLPWTVNDNRMILDAKGEIIGKLFAGHEKRVTEVKAFLEHVTRK